ncbi:DUF6311 domain-containing protein [Pigmentibacter sp. JX0631]|uniref:DUF6311 domain-containing protein n=1 Tax=Pigmentibacter sp. JX0631 TaxID=2976982 RepID=UPI00246894BE|nr:DUF6311 domain-containing protein [Pigmentibacter sp. JX0631]WGL60476.1 DUF6311 domain-containing protein [Pigmentibacter sp. JX0631]
MNLENTLDYLVSKKKGNFLFLIFTIIMTLLGYFSQIKWIQKHCENDLSNSICKNLDVRLYGIPALILILCITLFFLLKFRRTIGKNFFPFLNLSIKYLNLIKQKFINIFNFIDNINDQNKFYISFIVITFISLLVFSIKFSFKILDPSYVNWLNSGDLIQNYLGWYTYQTSPLSFPLGVHYTMNYPMGTSIGYTDSLPLFALIFKYILPAGYQYFGIWLLICHLMQAWLSLLIIRIFNRNLLLSLISSVFIYLSPVFLHRYLHMNLECHWLVLLTIYIYMTKLNLNYKLKLFSLILIISAWIHPYVSFLLAIYYSFFLFQEFINSNLKIKNALINFSITIFSVIISFYVIGYFHLNGTADYGYGSYSANIISIFNPTSDAYSNILKVIPINTDSFESFNYIGFGLILLFLSLLINFKFNFYYFKSKKNIGFLLSVIVTILVSLSPHISFGNIKLFSLPLTNDIYNILSIFRSNGRFLWPVTYLISIISLYSFLKLDFSNTKKLFILSILLIIQIYDINYLIKNSYSFVGKQNYDNDLYTLLKASLNEKRNIIIGYPSGAEVNYHTIQYLCAQKRCQTNVGYFARNDLKAENKFSEIIFNELKTNNLNKINIYYFDKKYSKTFASTLNSDINLCKETQLYNICVRK